MQPIGMALAEYRNLAQLPSKNTFAQTKQKKKKNRADDIMMTMRKRTKKGRNNYYYLSM